MMRVLYVVLFTLAMFAGFGLCEYSKTLGILAGAVFGLGVVWYAIAPWLSLIVSGQRDEQ